MLVVFSVVALIAVIALYDYFQSRSWQQVTSDIRNDTVFAQRNKQYGAYLIRRNYNKQLALILGGTVLGFGVLYATTRGSAIETRNNVPVVYMDTTIMVIPKPTKPEPEVKRPETASAPSQRTMANVEPVITETPEEATTPTIPEENIASSTTTNENPGPGLGGPGTGGTGTEPATVVETLPDPDVPQPVDEFACFPGGMDKLPPYLGKHLKYPEEAVQLGLEGRCFLKFVVGKTGDISDVKIMRGVEDCPECDREAARVVRGMPQWRPGKRNGRPVASEFNLPITFRLQH